MCALIFVGLGLQGAKGMPLAGIEEIRGAGEVYLERYTSPLQDSIVEEVERLTGRKALVVSREFLEDGREILARSRDRDVALLSPGDPMIATTHTDLRVRAEGQGVRTKIVHGPSILCAIPGETGLHAYNFGRTVTLTSSALASSSTVYNAVYDNLLLGLHTTTLLEYDYASNSFLPPSDAIRILLESEGEHKQGVFDGEAFIIVASRLGGDGQLLMGGRMGRMLEREFGGPPHALIFPGRLHFTEVEALKALLKIDEGQLSENTGRVRRLAVGMVTSSVRKTKDALMRARRDGEAKGKGHLGPLFENVECYASDAERFLGQGRHELAILSIGYAEGLLDSLRLTKELEIGW